MSVTLTIAMLILVSHFLNDASYVPVDPLWLEILMMLLLPAFNYRLLMLQLNPTSCELNSSFSEAVDHNIHHCQSITTNSSPKLSRTSHDWRLSILAYNSHHGRKCLGIQMSAMCLAP
jgi:hypothetical protein